MKNRLIVVALILSTIFTLTGCADELYEMTPEERQIIVDYSAHIIGKYNIRQPEGYTYVYEPKEEEEEDFSEFDEGDETDVDVATEGGLDIDPTDDASTDESGDDTSEDDSTPTADSHQKPEDNQSTGDTDRTSLSEALGLGTLKAVFTGAQYCLKYDTFVPEYGCGLCVVNIAIENPTAHDIKLDMLSRLPVFKARINDQVNLKSSITILLDDLSTFQGEIPANGSVNTVVIFQFKDDSIMTIDKLTMSVEIDGQTNLVDLL